MTREEAIRLLDPNTTREALAEVEYYNGFSGKDACIKAIEDACRLAIEALEKQVPKKPTNNSWTHYHCPVCMKSVNSKYCGNCGQAIDWSDEK